MRASIGGVLAIDEGIKSFPEAAVGVGETKLEGLLRVMERRINRFAIVGLEVLHHQVQQTITRLESFAVEDQLQAGIEIAVMPESFLDMIRIELDLFENIRVGCKPD